MRRLCLCLCGGGAVVGGEVLDALDDELKVGEGSRWRTRGGG